MVLCLVRLALPALLPQGFATLLCPDCSLKFLDCFGLRVQAFNDGSKVIARPRKEMNILETLGKLSAH